MHRTHHPTYLLSTEEIMSCLANKVNNGERGAYAPGLIRDLANLFEGGSILSDEEIEQNVKNNFLLSNKFTSIKDKQDSKFPLAGQEELKIQMKRAADYHKGVANFLRELVTGDVLKDIPGDSALERAVNLLTLLGNKGQHAANLSRPNKDGEEFIPVFSNTEEIAESQRGTVRQLHEKVELLKKLSPEGKELMEELTESESSSGTILDVLSNNVLFEILKASSLIDKISSIRTKPISKLLPDATGDIKKQRLIRDFSELGKVSKKDFGLPRPMLLQKIIQKELYISEKHRKENTMPIVALLIDESGSMNANYKREKALGILHNMLERVMRGETWLLFSFFEEEPREFHLFPAGDVEQVKEFHGSAMKHTFDLGITQVGLCIVRALEELEEVYAENASAVNFSTSDRHLIVINDGEDDCSMLRVDMLQGAKLHAFVLESSNEDLRRIAIQSGGSYRDSL